MELNKCNRCGSFYTNEGDVCPRCSSKDNFELSTFKSYIEENGFSSVDTIATETGIAQKNINRFLSYQEIPNINLSENENFSGSGVTFN